MLDWGYVVPLVGLALGLLIFLEGELDERRWRRQAEEEKRRAATLAE